MKKKFGEIFRKKENLKTKEEQSNISGKENKIEKPKIALTQKVQNLKIKISQNKVKVISSVVAILAIILTAIIAINQASKTQNGLSGISPELAKAMTYPEVGEGEDAVSGTDNVKFDAFFLRDLNGDGYAESIRGTSKEIGGEDTLYMELNVQTAGYLKDAKITINGENFYLQTALPKDNELKDNYVGNNTKEIEFNQINNGTQKLLTGVVRSGDYSYTSSKADAIGNNINNYSKVNSVTLTGTYVGEDGTETQIEKTVEFNIDWYGTTKASIYTTNQDRNIENAINEEEGTINLDFTVYTEETDKELILSKNHIEGTIPKLNDYAPIEVIYTGSNGVFNYDAETMTFTLDRTAQANEEGEVTSGLSRRNSYGIKVIYPIEAYQSLGAEAVTIKIPVKTYYEGYNNPSEEFTNPYKSNVVSATIVASYEKPVEHTYESYFDVTVGKYVYEPSYRYIVSKQKPLRIYNGESEEETDDTYTVTWRGYVGTNAKLDGMTMKETKDGEEQVSDQFTKTDASQESMDEVASNVGIYFSNADSMLGENGEIKVYDEDTGNLLVTFTQRDWNKYTSSNPYRYEIPVKHIRIETSAIQKNEASLYVYNIKEIDDDKITTKYTREEFDKLQYIKSTLVGYIAGEYVGTDTHQANYEAPISVAEISISKNTISTQSTEKNEKITIQAYADQTANQVKWQNGTFLVKLPEEIIDAQVNNVTINTPQVTLENYELIEQDGVSFIKIVTKNETPQTFQITIDVDLSPDPRIATTTKQIELYATNENGSDYYYKTQDIYDVNNNLNTEEMVNHRTTSLSMVSPNSLLTNQTATDYDEQGSEVISPEIADIKPVYAIVDQEQPEEQTAKIGVQVKNNYASTISEIEILGKIPFEGNTYVISNADLGSTFTTKMTNVGIEVPAELQGIATVYYSDNENPDRDISKAENNWKTAEQVENWDNIKTFLIDLGDYVMPTGKEFVFNYTVKIPNGLEFNQVAFSHHGVYFCLDTDQGKYRTETEPNKLGFRIAEKYDLELTKYQTGKDKVVPGATYSITEITKEGSEETRGKSKTAVTNSQGKLTITNLYAEKEYEIREINSPDDYELNGNVIRFIGHVDEEGNLSIEKTAGTTKGEIVVNKEEGENYKVNVQVEDEVKASIKITKKEEETDNTIQGARFKLTGYDLGENGRTLTTNTNGELTFNGLSVNQEYTLQEVKAEGYYLANPIKFKIVNNGGNYTLEKVQDETATGEIKEQATTEEEGIPTINIVIEDEKIPTYDLQLIKVKKTTESTVSEDELIAKAETALADTEVEYLAGAKFKLYKGTEEIEAYTTDETGKVTIEGLYQYEAEKDIDQTYTLKEVLAPAGYAKVKDITFKVEEIDGALVLKEINEYGEEIAGENYTAEGNTIKLTIEDSPSFKLIKKDAETKTTIPNVKFVIYNVDNGEVPATDSKGEIIGTKETINGKEYYTVSTDENGEITADLPEGLYKAVEVEAPEQYDISNSTYYFGIGASREAKTTMGVEFATSVGGSYYDYIESVAETSDGGYIAGGYFYSSSIQVGEYTLTNNSSSTSYSDGMLIKYSASGEVEWARSVGGSSNEQINSVASTSDGGVIVGGYFISNEIQVGEYTLTNSGGSDGMIIKYSASGEVEWTRNVGESRAEYISYVVETRDGGVIAGGYFYSSSIQVGEYTLTNSGNYDGMIIKYNSKGEVEWARSVGGSDRDYIYSVVETSDGGYIVGGYFYSSSIQVGEYTLTNSGSYDGMLIKYSSTGEVEWARSVGGTGNDYIESVFETSDGGVIAGGYFQSRSIKVGDYTLTNSSSSSYSDGMLIKYSASGEVGWARSVGGSSNEYINSVASTSDGGVIAGGFFNSSSIQVGDYTLTGNGDGMLIKYSSEGEVEWARSVGGSGSDYIESVFETSDGGYIAGGYFTSNSIQVGEYTLTNSGREDGMIIKYSEKELVNVDITKAEGIGGSSDDKIRSVTETSDGGVIAGGYFKSSEIQVGDYTLTNSRDYDGMIIKYSREGEVEWARSVGGSGGDYIYSVASTSDGGVIAGGYFESSSIQIGDYTLTNSSSSTSYTDGMLIKYSEEGEVEWARSVGGSGGDYIYSVASTSDGGVIAGGYFYSSSIQVGDYTLTNNGSYDGMLIKYSASGEVEWARSVGGSSYDYIYSVASTRDGGVIVGGYFGSSSIQIGDYTLTNSSSSTSYTDGMLIKYSEEGEVEWARSVGGSADEEITSVAETSDGGVIAGGYFGSSSIQIGDYTLTNNGSYDGMIIKYSASGEVEWARSVGGSNTDYIESVASTRDGGVIVGGYFGSSSIQIGDYTLTNNGSYDGMIIKYSASGEVEWARSVGGSNTDQINSVAETSDGGVIAGGYSNSSTIEAGRFNIENKGDYDGLILKLQPNTGVPEIQELTVENSRKEFKITTDVKEIDGVKGGSISGEDKNPYEKVKYGENSTNEIKMTPDENYEIISITVNGQEYPFTANEDGTYTMPQFTNMTEDKHIEVTYALKDNKLTINKVDSKTKTPLPGATFKIDQIEERTEPENVIGELTANGETYYEADTTNEVTEVQGELTNNGTYYFIKNEDGTLTPTNGKKYQTENGGSTGKQSTTANSYIPIDLSSLEGQYVVVVNAKISSESADYGYATINQSTSAPSYSTSTGRFMYISGTSSSVTTAKDYTSTALEGGQIYYLHLGYRKDSSVDTGDDQVVFNSIKVYGTNSSTYNFIENDEEGYESNNQGKDSTVANSYIPIDLTNNTGKYNLTVNAEVSSQSSDYGYATVTTSTDRVAYNINTTDKVRFIYISGEQEAQDYTTVLQGGQMYYLHLGYYKNSSTSSGDDKFTANSIKVTLNDSELYHTEVTTDSKGQGIVQIPFGKYQITETKAPEGYELKEEPTIIEFRADGENHEITIENQEKAKVIVHHYLKDNEGQYTTTKVAEDELLEGKIGTEYTTTPHLDLQKYELEKDENGNYVIPENAKGNYESGTIEIIYYYEEREYPLIVHHYIEGTTEQVPLATGEKAKDEEYKGKEGEEYTTEAIPDEELDAKYELVETPENATGTYVADETIVTYYYKLAQRPLTITKLGENEELLEGIKFTIKNTETQETNEYTTDAQGKITLTLPVGEYEITEIETQEDYDLPENPTQTIQITKEKETYELTLNNEKKQGTVITHYYIEGTEEKVPSTEEGKVVEDVIQTGKVGEIYATKEAENVAKNYEYVSSTDNTSGEIEEETIEVIYYYRLKEPVITTPEIEKESTTEKVTNEGQMIDYNIKYTAKIDDYTGKVTVTIIDTLPYEIDEQKSNISGGTYNAVEKTITWEETIEDIDTFTSGTKEIIITKQITLVYKDIDVTQEKIENKATGTIKLETPEKEETVEDIKEIPTEYLTNITVNKIWNDNETQSERRPESIIIMVKNGEETVQEKEISKANALQGKENQWTVTFEGLPKYDENGQEIRYTVDEKEKSTNDLYFYDKEITEVQDNQATIRNTFKKPEDTTSVTVTKTWEDNNNENNKRPTAIKVEVKAEGQTVKEQIINKTNEVSGNSNEWRYTFEDLPKYNEDGEEIEYTVEERAIGENDLEFYDKAKITGDMETGYTITNTFKVPDTKISVTVNKTWVDNDIQEQRRPESVVLVLKTKDNETEIARQEITISNAISGNKDKWQYTFENLPKYDENGNVIEYTVEEQEKAEGDLHFYNTQIGAMVDKVEEGEKTGDKEVTITNTFTRPEDQTEVVITKIWNDNNNEAEKRPESIKLQLKNGNSTIKEQEVTEANKVEGQEKEDIINKVNENKELTEQISSNTVEVWQYTFTGIQKYDENGQELKYTADETEVHSSDLQFYTKGLQGTTIINKFTQNTDKTSVTVTKKWVDNEVQEQRRPESVIIQVKNGMEVVASQEINVSNVLEGDKDTWQYTFENLPKYDAFNNIINYTIDEVEKASGDLSFYSKEISGTTITNTFVKPQDKIQITVNKEWVDQNDVYKKRPDTINLQVKNGEEVIAEKTVSKEDNWKYTFTNLDKYDENGQEINYTVDEEETKTGDLFYYEKEIGEVINNEGTESGKQATITNRMTKLPSLVIVKYVDINTDEEIEDRVNKEGIVGETFDVTEDKKDIPGYTLVEEPEEKTGTYTEETQVKTYYYAKNTKVIVKYLEKDDTPEDDADNKVLSEQITIEGYEGKSYSTEKKTIEGYTYVESKGKTSGKMEEDTIEVVYYYAPNTKVIVKYLEKDSTPNDNTDNKVLATEVTINGYVGEKYDTEQKTITNYTFIESTDNTEGTMTKDTIEVIYYYAQNTKVTVKYLEKDNTPSNTDNKVLAKEETIEGYEGQEYKTEQKDIENYVFVESTNNTEGTMTKDEIEVIYYYAQKTKAKVEHIDRETGEILKEETKEGKVGDIFETHPEDFEGYVLVESPKEPNIIMDKTGEQVVKYYYAHVSAGVIEKHIDEITGELLYSEEHKGNEGDSYDIPSRNFDGYDLLEKDEDGTNRLPENAKGKMTKEVIEVKYYYIKRATVRVEYIDKETGEKLTEDITIEGHEGDSYETEEKEFKDYNLVETPENAKGEMTVTKNEDGTWNTETVVTYYYEKAKKDTTVVEKHIDINTNKVLAEETHKGKVGDEYSIPSREFEGYELVTEDENGNNMLPENSKGTMTEKEIEVIYYYEKQATVKVEYIDKQTGEKLDEEEIKGHVGDPYETEEKEFDGYELVEVPSNSTGEMTEEEIVVKYYYQRKAEVEVQYLEKDTDYKLAENNNITGYVGDKYETEPKDIPYYKLVDQTENTEGTMTKEKITVTYYYEKQLFNLSVDKWVSGTTINGIPQLAQNYNSRDELYKIDIHRSKAETADVKITYTIRITNTGEIEGTADRITELIPQGYTYSQEDNSIYWQESNGILTTDALKDEMIKPGEYKDIEIVLRWSKGENNFGQKDNTVILSSETNPAGYEDINEEDNSDKSEMLLTVATGLDSTDRVVVIGIIEVVLVISVGLLLSYKKKEHKK